jgi:hypothetical protein
MAKGSPLFLVIAIIIMEDFEEGVFNRTMDKLQLSFWYVDYIRLRN